MARHALLLAFVVAKLFAQGLPSVKGNDVWVTKSIKWARAPRDYNPNLSSGSATVLYFRPDGRFGMMHCRLNRGPNYLVVSYGDGQVVFEGTWKAQRTGIAVRYRRVTASVSRVPPEQFPGPEETALVINAPMNELRFAKGTFVPVGDRLHATELDPEFFKFQEPGSR